ncbi:hypothetical protein ACOME3_007293 [Neoechinorhynchus agilis]
MSDEESNNDDLIDLRVYGLLDFDCFHVQVKFKNDPDYFNVPCAAARKLGDDAFLISTNYVARTRGLKKRMMYNEAMKIVPDLRVKYVNEIDGKVDNNEYDAEACHLTSKIEDYCAEIDAEIVERDVDEFLIDLTKSICADDHRDIPEFQNTKICGNYDGEDQVSIRLLKAGKVVAALRRSIWVNDGYQASAGISVNQVYAKMCCDLNRPYGQTILLPNGYDETLKTIPLKNLIYLGGTFGLELQSKLGIESVFELMQFTQERLENEFGGNKGRLAYEICRGIDKSTKKGRRVHPVLIVKLTINLSELNNRVLVQLTNELIEKIKADSLKFGRYPNTLFASIITSIDSIFNISEKINLPEEENIGAYLLDLATTLIRKLIDNHTELQ